MRLALIGLLLSAAFFTSGCQAAKNKQNTAGAVFQYSDWRYQNFSSKPGEGVFHSAVTAAKPESAPSDKANRLFAHALSSNCSRILVSISLNEYDKPFPKDIVVKDLKGEVRIDDLAPRPVAYSYDAQAGKNTLFINFGGLFDDASLRKEVQNGQMIRFTVEVEKEMRSFKFTLRNVNNAMTTLVNYCQESSAFQDGGASPPLPVAPGRGGGKDDEAFFK